MGRILGYVVLLCNLSLILGVQNATPPGKNENPETQRNHTQTNLRHHIQLNKKDVTFNKRFGEEAKKPSENSFTTYSTINTRANQMYKSPGLSSFISDPPPANKRKGGPYEPSRNSYYPRYYKNPPKRGFLSSFSQKLFPSKNYNKNYEGRGNGLLNEHTKLTAVNNDVKSWQPTAQSSQQYNSYQSFNHFGGRNPRFFGPQRQNSKSCNSCNSVPWVPLLDVPESYRKQRNQNFGGVSGTPAFSSYNSYDYHAVPSNTHDIVLPSSPLVPPTPPVMDGTISSSFGLPAGNIPTAHGMLAPLNHFLQPPVPTFSPTVNFLSQPTLLDGSPIPELSPVPIVPLLDSGQFFTNQLLDSSDIGLVPPTTNSLSVSNVVFTITEGNSENGFKKDHENVQDNINFKQNNGALSTAATQQFDSTPQITLSEDLHPPPPLPHHLIGNIHPPQLQQSPENFPATQQHQSHIDQSSLVHQQQQQQENIQPLLPSQLQENINSPLSAQVQENNNSPLPGKLQENINSPLPAQIQENIHSALPTKIQEHIHSSLPAKIQENQENIQPPAFVQIQDDLHLTPPPPPPPPPSAPSSPQPQLHQQFFSNHQPQQQQPHNYNGIEIFKSVPLAEFSTGGNNNKNVVNPVGGDIAHSAIIHQNPASGHVAEDQKILENDPSSYLVPPPQLPQFNSTFDSQIPIGFHDAKLSESQYSASFHNSESVPKPLTSPSASWLFLDTPVESKGTELKPRQPLITESQQIASFVNSEFQPIPPQTLPISQVSNHSKSKKVQIIIPYTTKAKADLDANTIESVRHEVFQTLQSLSNKSEREFAEKFESSNSPELNKLNGSNNNNWNALGTSSRPEVDRTKNPKYVTEMQHILAKNIKELLYREIEKPQGHQNYPLQNNIDNWTALEYSNHQTLTPKEPKEIISQALSVTSIPGTSISHLLLPSKKIPDEYFVSTAAPFFEETLGTLFNVTNVSVNSRPFTLRPLNAASNHTDSIIALSSPSPFVLRKNGSKAWNHDSNYTVVSRSRVNYWGKLNENLVLPESVSLTKAQQETTSSVNSPSTKVSLLTTDKIEIVTPVSVITTKKTEPTRRTTRHVRVTERTIFKRNTTRHFPRLKLPTTLKKLINATTASSPTTVTFPKFDNLYSSTTPFGDILKTHVRSSFPKSAKNHTEVVRGANNSFKNQTLVSRANFSNAIYRNVSTNANATASGRGNNSISSASVTVTERPVKTNQSDELSINDIIPFRNKELPWESDARNDTLQSVARQRKSLIKQVKSRRPRRGVSVLAHSLRPHSPKENKELGT